MKRLLAALFLVSAISVTGILWIPQFRWSLLLVASVAGYALLAVRKRKVILRLGPLTWTREELCRHVLITGDTGCGKTTSGFQPILVQLIQTAPDFGALVLGVKSDEHHFISELTRHYGREQDHIHLEIATQSFSGKWRPKHRYNLLSDTSIPWTTHAKMVVDIAASLVEGKSHAFFRPMAQLSLARAFELLEAIGKPVTISRAYDLLTSNELIKQALDELRRQAPSDAKDGLIDFFETTFLHAKAYEQTEGIVGTIVVYLGFFKEKNLAKVFSSDEPDSFDFSDFERGAIVTLSAPQEMATERRYIQTYLKLLFYLQALRRFDVPPETREGENLLLLVADEFQDIVTASEDGISDHKVIDRIRSANCAIIAGMQSEISADPQITAEKRAVLTLNMRTRLIFRAADAKGGQLSAEFIGKRDIWKKSRSSRPLKPATVTRRREQEFRVKPSKLGLLADHTAYVVHPSKRFLKKKIAPLDGKGRVYRWFR